MFALKGIVSSKYDRHLYHYDFEVFFSQELGEVNCSLFIKKRIVSPDFGNSKAEM